MESVNCAKHQGVIGSNYRKFYLVIYCKLCDTLDVLCTDIHAGCKLCYCTVTGECEDLCDLFAHTEFLDDGVFSAAATDYHNPHGFTSLSFFI